MFLNLQTGLSVSFSTTVIFANVLGAFVKVHSYPTELSSWGNLGMLGVFSAKFLESIAVNYQIHFSSFFVPLLMGTSAIF